MYIGLINLLGQVGTLTSMAQASCDFMLKVTGNALSMNCLFGAGK
jgi:hypothetical protein